MPRVTPFSNPSRCEARQKAFVESALRSTGTDIFIAKELHDVVTLVAQAEKGQRLEIFQAMQAAIFHASNGESSHMKISIPRSSSISSTSRGSG